MSTKSANKGPSPMITVTLYELWLVDAEVDNFMCCFALLYCKGLSNPLYLETFKSSPHWRPWKHCSDQDRNEWFPAERTADSLDKHHWELFLEHWYTVLLKCTKLEVKYNKMDGLGLYSIINNLSVATHLQSDWNTFLLDVSITKAKHWFSLGFRSFYEYDGKLCALWGKWMLANRSSKVTVGFSNLKMNGQTLQGILQVTTMESTQQDSDSQNGQTEFDSFISIIPIPPKHEYSLKNTQEIEESHNFSSQNGTRFNCQNKAYKVVVIEPWWDTTNEIGCCLKRNRSQLYINYEEEDLFIDEDIPSSAL